MPTKLELMEAFFDVAEDKQKQRQFADAAKDYQDAFNFFMGHSQENNLSVDAKTGSYSKTDHSVDDEKVFEFSYKILSNMGHCYMEINSYDDALKSFKTALSYNPKSYKLNAMCIKLKLKMPKLLKEVEGDISNLLDTNGQLDTIQLVEHVIDLASVQFQLKKYESALSNIEDAIERTQGLQNNWGFQRNMYGYLQTLYSLQGDIHKACGRKNDMATSYEMSSQYKSSQEKLEQESQQEENESDAEEMEVSQSAYSLKR